MKNLNQFLHEDPPAGHELRVFRAVEDSLRRNDVVAKAEKTEASPWGMLGLGFSAASLLGLISYLLMPKKSQDSSLLAMTEWMDDENLETEDIELLAQDIDILENLDLLEEMEKES